VTGRNRILAGRLAAADGGGVGGGGGDEGDVLVCRSSRPVAASVHGPSSVSFFHRCERTCAHTARRRTVVPLCACGRASSGGLTG